MIIIYSNIIHNFGSKYILSISPDHLFSTIFLFNLSVGVNSPVSTEKSPSIMVHFLIYYALEITYSLIVFIKDCMYLFIKGSNFASSTVVA